VSKTFEGSVSGIFLYDDFEKVGSIYTISRNVFDYFYRSKQFSFLFAEIRTTIENEIYDIHNVDLENLVVAHRFSHEISVADEGNVDEIEPFMVLTHPGINRWWDASRSMVSENIFSVYD